jgi:hypothetical protein
MFKRSVVWKGILYTILMIVAKGLVGVVIYFEYISGQWFSRKDSQRSQTVQPRPSLQPQSNSANVRMNYSTLYPPHAMAFLVGFAMIARGEIGFLIASLSQSSGTLTLQDHNGNTQSIQSSGEDIFLVIVWAVVLCTIVGPVGVEFLVRSIRQTANSTNSEWI